MAERRVPRIRFKGFEEDWEQRKVSELADRYDNLRVPVAEKMRVRGTTPYYGANGIQDYVEGFTHDGEFVLVAEDGANDLKNYPVQYVEGHIWVNNHAHVLQGKNKITDTRFLGYAISRANIEAILVGGGRAKLNAEVLMRLVLILPGRAEQIRLSSYLAKLDSLLSLHQRKLEKLKILKKAMLEKMFPKNGAKVPEIRFSGFTDDWEQRKLGEMAVISTGYPFNSNEFSPEGKYLVITNGNIQDSFTNVDESVGNRITLLDRKILDSYILDIGDILITMDGTVGRTAKVAGNGLILAQRVGRVKPIGNTEFMYQALSTGDFSKAMTELSHGGTIKHISLNEISLFEFKSPVREREQNTVGKLLYLFDTLLSLHQRKLEKLRQIKKSMLERMFV